MTKILNKIALLFSVLFVGVMYSQIDPKLSIFAYNPIMYNPAYAASFEGLSINSIYSEQWVGFAGAPKTLFLSGHSILYNSDIALGFDIMSDKIGAVQENNFNVDIAYPINLNDEIRLATGIKAGMNNFNVDYNMLTIQDSFEQNIADGNITQNTPIIGIGSYLYTEKWAIGFSTPNVLKKKYMNDDNGKISKKSPYYFITGAYTMTLDEEIYLQPNLIIRIVDGAPIGTLVAMNLNWKNKFYSGLNFEIDVSVGGFAGFRFFDNFMAGYSYDFGLNDFGKYNGGTHTFMINYRLDDSWSKKKCACYTF